MNSGKYRTIIFYNDYFTDFVKKQDKKIFEKILWTLRLIEEIEIIPKKYFKHIENTDGIYEIRVQFSSQIFRIFCFFDNNKIIVLANAFQKKTQKTPKNEIIKAIKIKKDYENDEKK